MVYTRCFGWFFSFLLVGISHSRELNTNVSMLWEEAERIFTISS